MADVATLRALATAKGYGVERAISRGCWRLIDWEGGYLPKANGSCAWSIAEAVRFLQRHPDW